MKQGNVSLRAPEPEDLEVMFSFENDAALWELGTATGPYSRYQMKRYIAENQNDLYADGQLRLMIVCEEQGLVAKYVVDGTSSACFEYLGHDEHCHKHICFHCKCEKCGKVIHLECGEMAHLGEHMLADHGFQWDFTRTVFYGICEECRGK